MNSKNFSEAMNKLEDKYITEAITCNHMSKTGTHGHIKKGFLIAALIAALLLLCAAAYAIIRSYSTTIENTTLYWYTDAGVVDSRQPGLLSPEEAAQKLAVLFMEDLKTDSEERTFKVTEYKNLSVSVMPTSQIDTETAAIYSLKEEEISPDTWLVEISVSYKYEGILSPVGPSNGEWIDILYQASPIGFLMTKDGNSYDPLSISRLLYCSQ